MFTYSEDRLGYTQIISERLTYNQTHLEETLKWFKWFSSFGMHHIMYEFASLRRCHSNPWLICFRVGKHDCLLFIKMHVNVAITI